MTWVKWMTLVIEKVSLKEFEGFKKYVIAQYLWKKENDQDECQEVLERHTKIRKLHDSFGFYQVYLINSGNISFSF